MKRVILSIIVLFSFIACSKNDKVEKPIENKIDTISNQNDSESETLITFYELGSTTCIPCKQMKPVMESISKKYGSQVKIIFYDVNKEPNRTDEFDIRLIPTQIFHDKNGKEVHRHEGFYPEAEIEKFLASQGINKLN